MMNPYPLVALNHFTVPWAMCGRSPHRTLREFEVGCRGLAAFRGDFIRKCLTFVQPAQSSGLHCRDVDEHIPAAVRGHDEAKPFGGIEPFDCAASHNSLRCATARHSAVSEQPGLLDILMAPDRRSARGGKRGKASQSTIATNIWAESAGGVNDPQMTLATPVLDARNRTQP